MTDTIKVLIVDDQDVIRVGLANMLKSETDIRIIDEARDGFEAISKTIKLKPDVVLMDIFMPRCSGLEAMIKIRSVSPDTKVVILTVSERGEDLFQVLKFGATGYLLKSAHINEIVKAVRMAVTGEVTMSPNMATKLVAEFRKKSDEPVLSSRELEILKLLGEGLTNTEIANRLFIGESTVRTYLQRLLNKLNLKNRAAAIAYAARNYIASPPV
ncbi:MAG: hypothetical protein A2144_01390 [Chloroflexi bacterium RBG_16_50_9]|nr:MAG: hypothetical protein A2144_01390 [Chloroflexi bacterium RBG_16_50_9]